MSSDGPFRPLRLSLTADTCRGLHRSNNACHCEVEKPAVWPRNRERTAKAELVLLTHSSRTKRPSEPQSRHDPASVPAIRVHAPLPAALSAVCVEQYGNRVAAAAAPDPSVCTAAAREDNRQKATTGRASPVEAERIQLKHSEWFFIPCSCEGCCGSVCPSASSSCSFCREDDDGDDGAAGSARLRVGGRGAAEGGGVKARKACWLKRQSPRDP